MFHESFREAIVSGQGCAIICAGSDSDAPHFTKIGEALDAYGIPYIVRISSAHKQVDALMALIDACNQIEQGRLVFIAVAGATDALSGVLSYHSLFPVISCPPDGLNLSCLQNPSGSSNATILRPKNVARFIAQMFSNDNPTLRAKLLQEKQDKIAALQQADERYHAQTSGEKDR